MRGADITQESLFTVAKLDDFVPATHPLRTIRKLADTALQRMSALFDTLYADTGRASIAPEKLMRAQLLQFFYSLLPWAVPPPRRAPQATPRWWAR